MFVPVDIRNGVGDRLTSFARRHRPSLALVAIVLAGAAIRFATLGDQSFDHDETVTAARVIHDNFFRSMDVVVRGERSPPLYYALVWLWSRIWGTGVIVLRSLSAIFGTVTVVVAYSAGRELVSRRAGLIAALLVALNPYLIWYSQEARSYGLLVMLEALGLYFFARAWHDPTRRSLGGWAIASGLALLTHYFAVFFIVPEALLLLVSSAPRRRRAIAIAIAAVVAVGLAVLPLAVVQEGTGRGNDFTQYPVAQRAETALVKYASAEGAAPEGGILSTTPAQRQIGLVGAGLLAVAVAVVAIRGSPTERRSGAGVGAIAMAAFGVPVVLAWLGFDFVDPRNLIGALVPALVALGIAFSPRPSAGVGTAGVLAASALFVYAFHVEATTPAMQRHDWRAAAAALSSRPKAELFVVPQDGRTPLQYYTGRRLEKFIPKHFADGVATRRIVVMTDFQPVRTPQPGFRLVKGQWAPQHWTVDVFASRHPVVVTPKRLADRSVIPQPSTVLIDGKRTLLAAEAADDRRVARARGARRG